MVKVNHNLRSTDQTTLKDVVLSVFQVGTYIVITCRREGMHLIVLAGSTESSAPALVEKLIGSLEHSKIYGYLILLFPEATDMHLL